MAVVIDTHARERIEERGAREHEVFAVEEHGDWVVITVIVRFY